MMSRGNPSPRGWDHYDRVQPGEQETIIDADDGPASMNHTSDTVYEDCQVEEPQTQEIIAPLTGQKRMLFMHNPDLFFSDGVRKIDFVVVWDATIPSNMTPQSAEKRFIFENNLEKEGLELESTTSHGGMLHFIKVHAPDEVLRRYAEILKLRMPMKQIEKEVIEYVGSTSMDVLLKLPGIMQFHNATTEIVQGVKSRFDLIMDWFRPDPQLFPPKSPRFSAVYSRDKEYLFDADDEDFFTSITRSRIVDFILKRKRFTDETGDEFAFGIERLVNEGVYSAAYPLHDGSYRVSGNLRHLLATHWTAMSNALLYQPLDYIKDYFGVKIALYFAWLGFYTHTLIFASIVGFFCFLYGVMTLDTNIPSNEICNGVLNSTMCPICDHFCDYWHLSETCLHAKVAYLFDNATTVFFAVFMSMWAVLFLEMWKRYSAEITHRWDLTGFDTQEEHPRPQYLARLAHITTRKLNVITRTLEPRVPFWKMKFPAALISISLILLLVSLALASVLGVILYRMSTLAALVVYGDSIVTSYALLFTTATAASINLVCILVFNKLYERIALWLTESELLRTQMEFEDSLTLKMYLLQFVNYYASIFYIAFFKGKFVGYPGKYNRLFGYRQEECQPGGCLVELCIQLAIIMVGKQAMNTILEMFLPIVFKWWNSFRVRTGLAKQKMVPDNQVRRQWAKDYQLLPWGNEALFAEYLEMVLQYGFVTIFVAAFPLAPLFALLNNILEMRLDARKILTLHRRPVSQRVKDIGVWYNILECLGRLSVITNGFIIAFTSDFIPRFVYKIKYSADHTLHGYVNYTLAYFNTSDFPDISKPHSNYTHVEVCRYPDFRVPPDAGGDHKYHKSADYWYILAARLAFVLVFQNVVAFATMCIAWCIPDVPRKLSERIRQEAYLTNEIIIKQEMLRARGSHGAQAVKGDATAWDPRAVSSPRLGVSRTGIHLTVPGNAIVTRRSKSYEPPHTFDNEAADV